MSDDEKMKAFEEFLRATGFGGSSDRPFVGQRWTFAGERGTAMVPEMRLRDLGDRIVGALDYLKPIVDVEAIAQNILCAVEPEGNFDRVNRDPEE